MVYLLVWVCENKPKRPKSKEICHPSSLKLDSWTAHVSRCQETLTWSSDWKRAPFAITIKKVSVFFFPLPVHAGKIVIFLTVCTLKISGRCWRNPSSCSSTWLITTHHTNYIFPRESRLAFWTPGHQFQEGRTETEDKDRRMDGDGLIFPELTPPFISKRELGYADHLLPIFF